MNNPISAAYIWTVHGTLKPREGSAYTSPSFWGWTRMSSGACRSTPLFHVRHSSIVIPQNFVELNLSTSRVLTDVANLRHLRAEDHIKMVSFLAFNKCFCQPKAWRWLQKSGSGSACDYKKVCSVPPSPFFLTFLSPNNIGYDVYGHVINAIFL